MKFKTTNYRRGADKERRILNEIAHRFGYKNLKDANDSKEIVLLRSAGSHSPVDCVFIDVKNRYIKLIQSKPKNSTENYKNTILEANKGLNGSFITTFEVL